jgi:hypothetical protein
MKLSTIGGSYTGGTGWQRDIRAQTTSHMIRAFACYGTPTGSHIGFWYTRSGAVRGVNLRIGRRYVGPCLTMLVHWR